VVQITYTVRGLTLEQVRERGGRGHVLSGPLGTGFFVDDEAHVVTAQHVIEAARSLPGKFPPGADVSFGVGLAYPNSDNMRANFNVVGFDLVGEDARHDLALVKMRSNPFRGETAGGIVTGDGPLEPLHGVPTIRLDRPRDGDRVAISGYPLGEPVLVTTQGIVASSWSVVVDDLPHPTIPDVTLPGMRDVYLADVQSNPGNSGGPVYSADDGAIVGVLVAGRLTNVLAGGAPAEVGGVPLLTNAGLALVIPAKYFSEMLDRNGVSWTAA
jgi:S1-C subfamily serine protease